MTTFYHGGFGNLQKGNYVLPPAITKARNLSEFGAKDVHRTDKVYVTTEYSAALLYASSVINGRIYVVEPQGEIESDPDCTLNGLSYQCDKAKVLKVIKPTIKEVEMARGVLLEGGGL